MKKIILIIVSLLIMFSLITVIGSYLMHPGNYAYAEVYYVNKPFKETDSIMLKIKKVYPEFENYIFYENGDSIVTKDRGGFIDFSLQQTGYTVSCRVYKGNNIDQTRILLVYARKNKNDQKFQQVNTSDLSKEENKKIKSFFEKQILDKIGKWNNDSFSFFD